MIYVLYDGPYSDAPMLDILEVPPELNLWDLWESWKKKITAEGPPGYHGAEWQEYWASLTAAGYEGHDRVTTFVSMLIKDHGCRDVARTEINLY